MAEFIDNAERKWSIQVNISAVKRVKALLGVDLLELAGGDLLQRLVQDPVLLADVIYALIKPQADADGVTDEDFGAALAGDAIAEATTAMLEALADFFPSPKSGLIRKTIEKIRGAEAKAMAAGEKMIDDPATDRAIDEAIAAAVRTPGDASGDSPGSSG